MDLLLHYYELPKDLFITLKEEFHKKFCITIQNKLNSKFKNCFHLILKCPKYHSKRLFNKEIRFTIEELKELQEFSDISKEELELNIENIGNHEDGTIINNPKLPFHLKDIVYIASHLMFDGSYRKKKGCYFYSYEDTLTEYHKNRFSVFGDVPNNLIKEENQLYFSYTLGYITSKLLEIPDFNSISVIISNKLKILLKNNKILVDEFIKAMIIDEGQICDNIIVELGNEKLLRESHEIISLYYKLNNITTRTRDYIYFKEADKSYKNVKAWQFVFSSSSDKLLYESISPIPIDYKQKSLELMYIRKTRSWFKRKRGETERLIIKSILDNPKSVLELSYELQVRNSVILKHIRGKNNSLINLGLVQQIEERILRKGGYAKAGIFGILDKEKAIRYLKK